MTSFIDTTIERNGTGIERNGTGIERNGTGIERNGTGIERNGTGIERNGTGARRGIALAFAMTLITALGPATANMTIDSDDLFVTVDGTRISFFKGSEHCHIVGSGTLIDGYATFDLTSSAGVRALIGSADASSLENQGCDAEYIRVVGNGTGDKVVGNGTGSKVVGNGTGDKVVGNGTGSPAAFWGEIEIALDDTASTASVLLYKADADGKTADGRALQVTVTELR
ncbi:hypothetical protein HFP89_04930 [Wenzhouxiangella sp. XN79A]|uniref:hypothetical protein n=1 Tax=Wenzhouxiangella sp. XN79A TaxID=2724193 RepID=UPI00144AEB08|nr:hypothetical protein [Wenzhouxiangella sp. XN79A]NKI34507.1 hypothetical protein [Wenzhouxiangella sp. XN79A]